MDPAETVVLVPPVATSAAALPGRTGPGGDVEALLTNYTRGLPPEGTAGPTEAYRQKLSLDFLGQPTVSGTFSAFGTRVSGGVSAAFSDMLGDCGLGLAAQIGGTLADFGGELLYVNRKHRWNWAAGVLGLASLDRLSLARHRCGDRHRGDQGWIDGSMQRRDVCDGRVSVQRRHASRSLGRRRAPVVQAGHPDRHLCAAPGAC